MYIAIVVESVPMLDRLLACIYHTISLFCAGAPMPTGATLLHSPRNPPHDDTHILVGLQTFPFLFYRIIYTIPLCT